MKVYFPNPQEIEQGYYVVEPKDAQLSTYVGDWAVDADILYHRHPDEYSIGFDGPGVVEYDVTDKVCWKCEARCPDEVWFIHRLCQL